jgi:hypothetical protein
MNSQRDLDHELAKGARRRETRSAQTPAEFPVAQIRGRAKSAVARSSHAHVRTSRFGGVPFWKCELRGMRALRNASCVECKLCG